MIVLKWVFPVSLAVLAIVHLVSCWRGDDDLRKPTKVALMPVVALSYLAFARQPSLWVVAGLLFGCLGDLFLVCMFAESDNMIFRVLLRSSRELAHVTYYIVAYTLDTQELCKTYRTVLDGLTSGHASEAIDYWCGWSDRVTVQYREALLRLESE